MGLTNGSIITWTRRQLKTGMVSSTETLTDSKDDSNSADSMMKTNCPMVDQPTKNDVMPRTTLPSLTAKVHFAHDTTKTTQFVVSNKSPKVSPSGLNDTSQTANFNQPNKLTDQTNGSVN